MECGSRWSLLLAGVPRTRGQEEHQRVKSAPKGWCRAWGSRFCSRRETGEATHNKSKKERKRMKKKKVVYSPSSYIHSQCILVYAKSKKGRRRRRREQRSFPWKRGILGNSLSLLHVIFHEVSTLNRTWVCVSEWEKERESLRKKVRSLITPESGFS